MVLTAWKVPRCGVALWPDAGVGASGEARGDIQEEPPASSAACVVGGGSAQHALCAEGCVGLSRHPGRQPGILLPGDMQSTRHQTAEGC